MNEELQKKIKNPIYLIWMIVRTLLGLLCGLIGFIALKESGFINFILWLMLAAQFWVDGDMVKSMFKINRFIVVAVIFVFILITI